MMSLLHSACPVEPGSRRIVRNEAFGRIERGREDLSRGEGIG